MDTPAPPDETAARLAAIVQSSDDVIVSKTLQGVITSWNPAAERMFGYPASEAIGRHISLIIPEERLHEEEMVLARIRRGEAVEHFETERVTRDGRRVEVSLTISPIRNAAGEVIGASKIARDITERRRLERAAHLNRQWLSTVLRSIGDAVITTDPRGAVTFLNPVAAGLTGWASEDATGRPLAEVFPIVDERTRAPVEGPVDRALREGNVVGLPDHALLLARDGCERGVDATAAPIRADDGSLGGVVLVFHDVTAKRRQSTRRAFLSRASEELSASLDYAATLRRLVHLAVPEIADWAAVELVEDGQLQRLAVAHVDPAKLERVAEIQRTHQPEGDARHGTPRVLRTGVGEWVAEIPPEVRASKRDSRRITLVKALEVRSYIGVPLRTANGVLGVLTLATAESGRHYDADDFMLAQSLADRAAVAVENARLFGAVERARAEAEVANRSKDEFLAMLGHELRNPLAPILTALALIRLRTGAALEREHTVIERQVRNLTRLVDDLLDVSRITRGKVDLSREAVAMADVAAQAVEMASPLIERRAQQLSVSVPAGLVVEGDAARLAQVLGNLLNNAAKFTGRGGRIEVGARRDGAEVELWVRDSGIGIAPEMLPRVFDPFVQEKQSSDRAQGGLGLGLAIVQRLVDLHGGTATAESEGVGRGSVFRVRLPVAAEGAAPRTAASSGGWSAMPGPSAGARVLVVDDNVDSAEMVGEMLRIMGHDVLLAHDGPSALTVATAGPRPDLALLDIGLPVMDGYELGSRLRAMEGGAGIRLAALTGYGQPSDRQRSDEAGFDAHLVKPIGTTELRATVDRLLGRASS